MTKEEQASQLRLAAGILETGHPWEVKFPYSSEWDKTPKANPAIQVVNDCEIRITLATPPDNRPLHNPNNLTAEQVGVGYRLLLADEVDNKQHEGSEFFPNYNKRGWRAGNWTWDASSTIRLPLSIPWPGLPEPEPATKTMDLGPEDVPPGSVFKHHQWKEHSFRFPKEVNQYGVHWFGDGTLHAQAGATHQFSILREDGWLINRSIPLTGRWDPIAWEPCHKQIPAA